MNTLHDFSYSQLLKIFEKKKNTVEGTIWYKYAF